MASTGARLGVGGCHRLGLWRATLAQEDAKHGQDGHGQELALPVLHGLEPELGAGDEAPERNGCGAVLQLLLVELGVAAEGVEDKGEQKQPEQGQRQRMLVSVQRTHGHPQDWSGTRISFP